MVEPRGLTSTDWPSLDTPTRRWLHDKFERLAAEEGQLASGRTSYFAAIGTVLITGLIIAVNYFLNEPRTLLLLVTFVAGLGILISVVWVILLHRTTDAQQLWREQARTLERIAPPVEGAISVPVTLRSGAEMEVDLLRPYTAHAKRFARDRRVSWMDRVRPEVLTEILPISFLVIWCAVLSVVWIAYWASIV